MVRWTMVSLGHRLNAEYRPILEEFCLGELEEHRSSVLAIDRDGRIVYVNPYYLQFARDNGGESLVEGFRLGQDWLSAVSGPLHEYYQHAVSRVWVGAGPWEHDYECSSPDTYRRYRLVVYPMAGGAKLMVHSLRVERPHDAPFRSEEGIDRYRDCNGIITMCSVCRCTRRPEDEGWDWVPRLLHRGTTRVSHGLCPPCYGHYLREFDLHS